MNDALTGHVDLAIGSAALVAPQVSGGKLRGLAQTGASRIPGLPAIPTVIESGFPGFNPTPGGARSRPGAHLVPSSIASAMRWRRHYANRPSRAASRRCRLRCRAAARMRSVNFGGPDETLGPCSQRAQHQER